MKFVTADNENNLEIRANQALNELINWLKCSRLTFNTDKTHLLDFSVSKTNNMKCY